MLLQVSNLLKDVKRSKNQCANRCVMYFITIKCHTLQK